MGIIALLYGAVCYAVFFAAFLYLIVFTGGDSLSGFLSAPKTIDAGPAGAAFAPAAFQNIALLLLFGVSHSVMARPGFKKWWTKIVPQPIERSTYVLVSTLVLILVFHLWIPMPDIVWATSGAWSAILLALMFIGFLTVLLSTFMINHFDLFGLRQVWANFKNAKLANGGFSTPYLYAVTRHPLYLGFVIAFWAIPVMTVGHLLFASVMTIYIFVAIGYEERDLIAHFGEDYRRYMERVPMLFPIGRRK